MLVHVVLKRDNWVVVAAAGAGAVGQVDGCIRYTDGAIGLGNLHGVLRDLQTTPLTLSALVQKCEKTASIRPGVLTRARRQNIR